MPAASSTADRLVGKTPAATMRGADRGSQREHGWQRTGWTKERPPGKRAIPKAAWRSRSIARQYDVTTPLNSTRLRTTCRTVFCCELTTLRCAQFCRSPKLGAFPSRDLRHRFATANQRASIDVNPDTASTGEITGQHRLVDQDGSSIRRMSAATTAPRDSLTTSPGPIRPPHGRPLAVPLHRCNQGQSRFQASSVACARPPEKSEGGVEQGNAETTAAST